MVPKDTKKTPKWDPWAPKVFQSGAEWDPKGGKSALQKCKRVTLGNPGEPKATKMETRVPKWPPGHPKLRFGGQKRLPKCMQQLVLHQNNLSIPSCFLNSFWWNISGRVQNQEREKQKTRAFRHDFKLFLLHPIRHSTTVQQPGSAAQAVRPLQYNVYIYMYISCSHRCY